MTKISELLVQKDNLNLIKTNKYKDINVYFKFAFKYSKRLYTCLTVLSQMMELSNKYQTKDSMQKAKDMLYGFSAIYLPSTLAGTVIFTINYSFVNPKFLNDIKEQDYINFIDEILKHPLFTNENLQETIRNIKDATERGLDIPSTLAYENFISEASKDDERYLAHSKNILSELDDISLDDISKTYNSLFETKNDIFVVGDYSDLLVSYLSKYKSYKDIKGEVYSKLLDKREDITFKKDVGQSTLIVSYTTPYTRDSKDFYAYNLANIMFGGIPSSLLFSEVREKYSLCYTISARALRYESMVIIKTEIDATNKDKALCEIRKQFERMKNLDFDHSLLDIAKVMLINNSLSIDDDIDYLIDFNYAGRLTNTYVPINKYIENVNKVTLDDIKKVCQNYKEYLVYFFEGTKHE